MKRITAYQSDDGRIFRTQKECREYESPRIIEKCTNVDFCKRVEVRCRKLTIDRYLTIPGWKLEGFEVVHPRRDTPIYGRPWGGQFEGFLSNIAIQSHDHFPTTEEWYQSLEYFCRQWVFTGEGRKMRIAEDFDDAIRNGMKRHYFELNITEGSATVIFDGFKKYKLTKL